jgi:site-specific recombinase XerD
LKVHQTIANIAQLLGGHLRTISRKLRCDLGRRGFLTRLTEKGVSVRVMMQLAGHSQISSTQRYIDTRPDILRNAWPTLI